MKTRRGNAEQRKLGASAREAVPLKEHFSKRLAAYAAAAGAAGIGVLAPAQPAKADIIFTPANVVLTNGVLSLDLNHDGINDFILGDIIEFVNQGGAYVYHSLPNISFVAGGTRFALALPAGSLIGTRDQFHAKSALLAFGYRTSSGFVLNSGYWANVGNRFLGLRFKIDAQLHYGWVELSVTDGPEGGGFFINTALMGYAYDTVAGQPLRAGHYTTTFTPEPGTLGLLALGSLGLGFWRRKKQERVTSDK